MASSVACSGLDMLRAVEARTLRIQTVLYHTDTAQIWRLTQGLSAAGSQLLATDLVSRIEWALGDSTPSPIMTASDAQAIQDATAPTIERVSYDHFDANLGSSGGQNRLAANHPSDLLLVLNPDTYPAPNALVELVRAVDQRGVGIAEARQIPLEHPREFDPTTGDTGWASGYCMLVQRPLFERLKGFDATHFLLHCDDVDFSWRARAAGHRVVTAPLAVVFHDKRPQHGDAWPVPDVELYHSTLGRLMLATRWDRDDIVTETIEAVERGQSEVQLEAIAEYRRRKARGHLPSRHPNATEVAQFVDGEYAPHRF